MKNKYFLIIAMLCIASCSSNGRITDSEGNVYSEYFQCLIYTEDKSISFDALKTFGKERLPKGHVFSESDIRYLNSPDTIEDVYEVYVRNHGDTESTLTLIQTTENSLVRELNEVHTVPPGKWVKSQPVVRASSIYGPIENVCSVTYKMGGKVVTLNGKQKRLKVSEVGT